MILGEKIEQKVYVNQQNFVSDIYLQVIVIKSLKIYEENSKEINI